jgi:NAD(P)-dependent dehydrogenase (short-subunit alcohol dehydrogenase family)
VEEPTRSGSQTASGGSSPGPLLANRRALVSGAGPGLGREVALLFARHGAEVAIGARSLPRVEAIAEEIRSLGGRAEAVECDVTDPISRSRALDIVGDRLGGLDVLVNNAFHAGDFAIFEEADIQKWREVFETNFFGTLALTQEAVGLLKESGDGRVVMVNTMSVVRIEERFGAYAASKAALASATKTLARELGRYGIRVNGVHPGFIWGEANEWYLRHRAAERSVSFEEEYHAVASQTCLGYLPAASEVAGSVLFFASELSRPVTGQALGVNAGQVFQGV